MLVRRHRKDVIHNLIMNPIIIGHDEGAGDAAFAAVRARRKNGVWHLWSVFGIIVGQILIH